MKKFHLGDAVWCWRRDGFNNRVDGFKAECIEEVNATMNYTIVKTKEGTIKEVKTQDLEPYCDHEDKIFVDALKKFKSLSPEKQREMITKIGLFESRNNDNESSPSVTPNSYLVSNDWDASKCVNFDECWCGRCAYDCA